MRNIKGIFKKEFDKVFKFPRSLFSTLILPGLIIFVMYFFIGKTAENSMKKVIEHQSNIITINVPESFTEATEAAIELNKVGNILFSEETLDNLESLKVKVQDGEIDVIIVFEEDFESKVDNNSKPQVVVYFNETAMNSSTANTKIQKILEIQKNSFLEEKEIDPNIFSMIPEQVIPKEKTGGTFLSMILPILILSFIFGSAMGIGSDAIAGEKERGTLATLLVLPIPRNHIIIGKIISTTTLTILAALSSFIGVIASLPFMKFVFELQGGVSYGVLDYLALLGLLIVLATLASSLLLLTSTIAKTVKEATAYAMPIFLAVMILPIMSSFNIGEKSESVMYLVPIYNFTLIMKDLLSFNFNLLNYLFVIGSSVVLISLLVFVLIKMFKNEKVLFSK
jgi:sodium transport system permease protein